MSFKDILRKRAKKNSSVKMLQQFTPYDVIKYPVNSEKSLNQSSLLNAYHFVVDSRASKNDVKKAVSSLYNVEVLKVTTSNLPHKWRMNRKTVRKPLKKAVITLKKGDAIVIA